MAKNKRATAASAAPEAEITPLALGQAAEQGAPSPSPAAPVAGDPPGDGPPARRFRVSLGSHGPTSDHEADDEAHAWEAYKAQHGIVGSRRQPLIQELGGDGQPLEALGGADEDDEDFDDVDLPRPKKKAAAARK